MLGEGALDQLKAGLAGAKAGFQSGADQRQGTAQQQEVAREFINRWNQAVAQDPNIATPEALQQFMQNSTRKSGIKVPPAPAAINDASVAQYITKVIGQSMAARRLGLQPAEEPATDATGAEVPADAKAADAKAERPELTPGFTMVDDDPVTIKYKKQDFARNDQGYWAPLSTPNKPVTDSATTKMFDKQEQAIENWKAAQTGTEPPPPKITPTAPPPSADADTGAEPTDTTATTSAKPDDRTAKELLSPKGIRDPESEVFIPGHGIMQKQEDGSWRHLPKKAPINPRDWPALDKRLEAARAAEPADTAADAEPATDTTATSLPGAPIKSKVEVSGGGLTVGFQKGDEGWRNIDPTKATTTHKPGSKAYDALERQWARLNGKLEPKPTVGTTPPAATPAAEPAPAAAMTESFRRLSRITHGKI